MLHCLCRKTYAKNIFLNLVDGTKGFAYHKIYESMLILKIAFHKTWKSNFIMVTMSRIIVLSTVKVFEGYFEINLEIINSIHLFVNEFYTFLFKITQILCSV